MGRYENIYSFTRHETGIKQKIIRKTYTKEKNCWNKILSLADGKAKIARAIMEIVQIHGLGRLVWAHAAHLNTVIRVL